MIPVLVLAYNRPDKLRAVLSAVHRSRPSKLYIVVDGAREAHRNLVSETRAVVDEYDWGCDVERVFHETNLGVKRAMTAGLDRFFEQERFGAIIEDDCFPSPDFFRFLAEADARFSADKRIGMVSGTNFLRRFGRGDHVLFTEGHIWGWGTWADRWREYRSSVGTLNEASVRRYYGLGWPYRRMLISKARAGVFDSWAIPWLAYLASEQLLSVTPPVNLVTNVGHGLQGTHTSGRSRFANLPLFSLGPVLVCEGEVSMNRAYQRRYATGLQVEYLVHTLRRPFVLTVRKLWRSLGKGRRESSDTRGSQ